MNYLLDADPVIDYFANQPDVVARFPQILRDGAAISSPTAIELFTGVHGARDPRTAERDLRLFLRAV
jgi:predicted nucleic acid-binding protein